MLGVIIDEFFNYRKNRLGREQVYDEIDKLHQLVDSQPDLSLENITIGKIHYVKITRTMRHTKQSIRFVWHFVYDSGYEFYFDRDWYNSKKIVEDN